MRGKRRSQSLLGAVLCIAALAVLTASCASDAPATAPTPTPSPVVVPPTVAPAAPPTTLATDPSTPPSTDPPAPTSSTTPTETAPTLEPDVLAGISMTSVPPDVIVPSNEDSLDKLTNPINGRRGGRRPLPEDLDCAAGTAQGCLTTMLDQLGFDVTSGSKYDSELSVERATAVVQLDAGLPMTGLADDDLLDYLGIPTDTATELGADEVRQIGTSAKGLPITALRYGDGPTTVLVVGQTHGDEEGGLRILLRVRSLSRSLPDKITMWVIPTMNPDGLALDTRFLVNGSDPNRQAPTQLEQQAVYDFALSTRPSLSVWYHQNYGWVGASGASVLPARKYQQLTGLGTLKRSGDCVTRGFMWCPIDDALGSSSILVELPDVLTPAEVQSHALALLAVASDEAAT